MRPNFRKSSNTSCRFASKGILRRKRVRFASDSSNLGASSLALALETLLLALSLDFSSSSSLSSSDSEPESSSSSLLESELSSSLSLSLLPSDPFSSLLSLSLSLSLLSDSLSVSSSLPPWFFSSFCIFWCSILLTLKSIATMRFLILISLPCSTACLAALALVNVTKANPRWRGTVFFFLVRWSLLFSLGRSGTNGRSTAATGPKFDSMTVLTCFSLA
mmetsp:Transcript_3248/g.6125  ORF Transcript_3248/g.6125 Transcript_3248/m.6125 type:complete len:219 (+) Transcript_3248:1585-2241(+)